MKGVSLLSQFLYGKRGVLSGPVITNKFRFGGISPRFSSHFTYVPDTSPSSQGETVRMNFFQAVNNAMDIALATDPSCGMTNEKYIEIMGDRDRSKYYCHCSQFFPL
jgi:hypothetical protein